MAINARADVAALGWGSRAAEVIQPFRAAEKERGNVRGRIMCLRGAETQPHTQAAAIKRGQIDEPKPARDHFCGSVTQEWISERNGKGVRRSRPLLSAAVDPNRGQRDKQNGKLFSGIKSHAFLVAIVEHRHPYKRICFGVIKIKSMPNKNNDISHCAL